MTTTVVQEAQTVPSLLNTTFSSAPRDVETTLNYLKPNADGTPLISYVDNPASFFTEPDTRPVTVHDVRGQEEKYTLDGQGFQFFKRESSEKEFVDDEKVKREYYPEVEQLLKDVTGASRIYIFDHTIRRPVPSANTDARPRGPVQRVHSDQTDAATRSRVIYHLPADADHLLQHRVQIINVWRPIKPVQRDPLALADATTVNPDSFVVNKLIYPDREGETYQVKWDEGHRWYYKSDMEPDEVILIKCSDSKRDGRALRVPHTAFAVPGTEDREQRESIEVRCLVFHEDEAAE